MKFCPGLRVFIPSLICSFHRYTVSDINEQMDKRRRAILGLAGALSIGAVSCADWMKFDLGGGHFVGTGVADLELRLFDGQLVKVNSTALRADAIRLNQAGSQEKAWSLSFFNIPLSASGGPSSAQMTLTLEFDEAPVPGIVSAGWWRGVRMSAELFSGPITADKTSRLRSKTLRTGQVSLQTAQLKVDGKLAGHFEFSSGSDSVKGRFDLVLKEAPPLIP